MRQAVTPDNTGPPASRPLAAPEEPAPDVVALLARLEESKRGGSSSGEIRRFGKA